MTYSDALEHSYSDVEIFSRLYSLLVSDDTEENPWVQTSVFIVPNLGSGQFFTKCEVLKIKLVVGAAL